MTNVPCVWISIQIYLTIGHLTVFGVRLLLLPGHVQSVLYLSSPDPGALHKPTLQTVDTMLERLNPGTQWVNDGTGFPIQACLIP